MLAKIGAWMQAAQLVGVIGTSAGMIQAFNELGTHGVADSGKLSAAISWALHWGMISTCIAVIGLVLVVIAATVYRYRAPWFFWFLCLYGTLILAHLLPFGLFCLIYALMHRHEFEPASKTTPHITMQ